MFCKIVLKEFAWEEQYIAYNMFYTYNITNV